jgi:chromatin structure-remodeling complex protein RSC7
MDNVARPTQRLTVCDSRFNSTLSAMRMHNLQGVYDIHTNVMQYPAHMQPTHARWEVINDENDDSSEKEARLPRLDPVYGRNFRIHDIWLESAPESTLPTPGLDGEDIGLASIPSLVLEELPAEALQALEEAKARERTWRSKWHTERTDGLRANFMPSVAWYPH